MKAYYVDNFATKSIYHAFLSYVGAFSDAFTLIYFLYNNKEKPYKTVRKIRDALNPYLIYEKDVNCWPSTITQNENHHIYHLRAYRTTFDSIKALEIVDSLWDFNYPEFPMDLCFYRNGYAFFASSTHEHWDVLYTDEPCVITDLLSVGLKISPTGDVNNQDIYFDKQLSEIKRGR